jgi:adenine/guanine/hypoxanthine permease
MLEALFKLSDRGASVRTELVAGATTFLTMAYIIVVNPLILKDAGLPLAAAATATCLAAALGSIGMGLGANTPFAMAPGMGMNAYFTYTVVKGMHVPWPAALACVFLSGAVFLLLTLVGARRLIVESIPRGLYAATAGGIGLFIAFIGLKNAGLVVANPDTLVALGDLMRPAPLIALGAVLFAALLISRRIKGALLLAMAAAAAVGLMFSPASGPINVGWTSPPLLALNLGGVFQHGAGRMIEVIFVFLFVSLFDNVGTTLAVARQAGLVESDGRVRGLDRLLAIDSLAAMAGALLGTSTVTTYIESASGIAEGGRTGLTAVTVGLLFLAALPFTGLVACIPPAATAPALVLVGAMMMAPLAEIAWGEVEDSLPAFLCFAAIPLTFSIANGLSLGLIAHVVLKIARGQLRRGDALAMLLALAAMVRFAVMARG